MNATQVSMTVLVDSTVFYAAWGLSVGLPWAQWSLIAIFCMLLHGPLWQRVLIYFGLSAISAVVMNGVLLFYESELSEALLVGYISPLLSIIIAVPIFMARVFYRWTLAPRNGNTCPRPTSLASYLTVMTIVGLAFTASKYVEWSHIGADAETAAIYILVFGPPLLAVGFVHLWLVPKLLDPSQTRSKLWTQWLVLGLVVATASVFSIVGYAAAMVNSGTSIDWSEASLIPHLTLSIIGAAGIFLAAGYYWLRLLGYQLVSKTPGDHTGG